MFECVLLQDSGLLCALCVERLLQDSGCKMDAMLLLRRVLRLRLRLCWQFVLTCVELQPQKRSGRQTS